jgi:hypothetical protein
MRFEWCKFECGGGSLEWAVTGGTPELKNPNFHKTPLYTTKKRHFTIQKHLKYLQKVLKTHKIASETPKNH